MLGCISIHRIGFPPRRCINPCCNSSLSSIVFCTLSVPDFPGIGLPRFVDLNLTDIGLFPPCYELTLNVGQIPTQLPQAFRSFITPTTGSLLSESGSISELTFTFWLTLDKPPPARATFAPVTFAIQPFISIPSLQSLP